MFLYMSFYNFLKFANLNNKCYSIFRYLKINKIRLSIKKLKNFENLVFLIYNIFRINFSCISKLLNSIDLKLLRYSKR